MELAFTNHWFDSERCDDEVITLSRPFFLENRQIFNDLRVGVRRYGPHLAPLVVVLGGISANRQFSSPRRLGWWSELIGPGSAIDTRSQQVLSFDFLGGPGLTTSPANTSGGTTVSDLLWSAVSTKDQACLLKCLLDHLGLDRIDHFYGASYGGMVALQFANNFPHRVGQLTVLGAADRPHPMATARRSLQREILRWGQECGDTERGIQLARALAMTTYRSGDEFLHRFSDQIDFQGNESDFPSSNYVLSRGREYAKKMDVRSFQILSQSIDTHRLGDIHQDFPKTHLIAFDRDEIAPPALIEKLSQRIDAELTVLRSIYGHDGFLKETKQLSKIFQRRNS